MSRTGAAGEYGERVARGFDLAVAEINAAGGVHGRKIELLYRDDSTNPDLGLAALRELVEQERVPVVLGAVSSTVTLRLAPYCERQRVVLLSPSASTAQLTDAGEYIFRAYPSEVLEGRSMAEFARDLGLERVGVLAVDGEYGASLTHAFEERFRDIGGTIAVDRTFVEGDDASRAEAVRALLDAAARGVYVPAYVGDVAAIAVLLRASDQRPVVLGTSAISRELIRVAGVAAENAVFPSASFDAERSEPATRNFVASYRARYGDLPDVYAAHAYDTVRLLARAAERGDGWKSDTIKGGLLAIDDYEGATGRMAFDPNGDVVQYPRLFVVRGGQFVPYDRFVESGGSLPVPPR